MLTWNKNRLGQDVVVRTLPTLPACALEPGAVLQVNAQGQLVCVNPQFLPEDKKQVPSCGAGEVPVLSAAGSWSCMKTGTTQQQTDKKIPWPVIAVGGAVLAGVVWVLVR